MKSENGFANAPNGEQKTSPRHSFANSGLAKRIGLEDFSIGISHDTARLIRHHSNDELGLRETLEDSGIILGRKIDSETVYIIPRSSRPLGYDAPIQRGGLFGYGDEQALFDVGVLLGKVASLADGDKLLAVHPDNAQDFGQMIALVDFTLPSANNVFLVPGVEDALLEVGNETPSKLAQFYYENLLQMFGGVSDDAAYDFYEGFNQQLGND